MSLALPCMRVGACSDSTSRGSPRSRWTPVATAARGALLRENFAVYCRVAVCETKIFLFFQSSNTYVLPRATSHPHLGHFSFPNLASSTSQDPNTVNCAATACRMLLQRHLALGRTPKCAFVPRKSRRPSDPPPSWRRPLCNYLRGVSSCSRPVSAGRMRRTRGPHQGG